MRLDLSKPEDFDYSVLRPGDTALVCAAISSPDVCGREPALARQVNVLGPDYFVRHAAERGARGIFLSSDTVIGATNQAADESATPSPHGLYGQMKWELEQRLRALPSTKVLRLSLVISLKDKFTSYLRQCLQEGKPPSLLHPIYRNAVHISDVIALVDHLTRHWERSPANLIHVSGPRCISRIGVAESLFECVGYSGPYSVETPPGAFYAQRPERIETKSAHFGSILGRDPVSIGQGYRSSLQKR